jgi:spermidine synthase
MNAHCALAYRSTRVVDAYRSEFQTLEVLETPAFGLMLRIDGTAMTSEADEFYYHENLVHVPAMAHAGPARVAIVGGGDGGALREVLKHASVEQVSLVELDRSVVGLSRRHLGKIHQGSFDDPRATLHFADGRSWLEGSDARFDLILLDLTDPVGPAHALYTAEFYALCRERLAPGGIVALHAQSPVTRPRTFARIMRTVRSVFPVVRPYLVFVPTYGTWFAMATASMEVDPAAGTIEAWEARVHSRKLPGLRFYNAATHLAGFGLPNFVRALVDEDGPVVHDEGPRLDEDPEFDQTQFG